MSADFKETTNLKTVTFAGGRFEGPCLAIFEKGKLGSKQVSLTVPDARELIEVLQQWIDRKSSGIGD